MNELERLEKTLNESRKPIKARLGFFYQGIIEIRKHLETYFLDQRWEKFFAASTQSSEPVFYFKRVSQSLQNNFHEDKIAELAQTQPKQSTNPQLGLDDILDKQLINASLPLQFKNGIYIFPTEHNWPSGPTIFMQEFAAALSLYRSSLAMSQHYLSLSHLEYLDSNRYSELQLELTTLDQHIQTVPKEQQQLSSLLLQAKRIKNHINTSLKQANHGLEGFISEVPRHQLALDNLIEQTSAQFETYYQGCSNKGIGAVFFDSPFQRLLKNIAKHLFADQYQLDFYNGALKIRPEFKELISKEICQFYETTKTNLPDFRVESLMALYSKTNQAIITMKTIAAKEGLELLTNNSYAVEFFPSSSKFPRTQSEQQVPLHLVCNTP